MAELWTNNASGTLNGSITDVATSLAVQTGEGALLPNPTGGDYFYLSIENEILKCTARSTDTLTVVRAQQGTTGAAHADDVAWEHRWTADSARYAAFNTVQGRVSALRYIGVPSGFGTNGTIAVGTLYAVPFYVGAAQAFDGIVIGALGTASAFCRLGIYADSAGKPGALIVDAGQVDCAAAGEKVASITKTLSGLVWVAAVGQSVAPSVTRMSLIYSPLVGATSAYAVGPGGLAYSQGSITGALPDPWGSTYTSVAAANTAPLISLRTA